ncbi:MAG: hypothetical protein V1659_01750 [Candidatus Woesearchaeota archaeon]
MANVDQTYRKRKQRTFPSFFAERDRVILQEYREQMQRTFSTFVREKGYQYSPSADVAWTTLGTLVLRFDGCPDLRHPDWPRRVCATLNIDDTSQGLQTNYAEMARNFSILALARNNLPLESWFRITEFRNTNRAFIFGYQFEAELSDLIETAGVRFTQFLKSVADAYEIAKTEVNGYSVSSLCDRPIQPSVASIDLPAGEDDDDSWFYDGV